MACDICHSTPCRTGCPNAEDEKPVAECIKCEEPLYADDAAYTVDDTGYYCESCFLEEFRTYLRRDDT